MERLYDLHLTPEEDSDIRRRLREEITLLWRMADLRSVAPSPLDEVRSGRGYQSHFGSRLHFGLGGRKRIDKIRVHWPALGKRKGRVAVLENVDVDRVVRIEEGDEGP